MQEYRNTQTETNQITDVQLPTQELTDVKSLVICMYTTINHISNITGRYSTRV